MRDRRTNRIAGRVRWRGFSEGQRILCGLLAALQILLPSLAAALPSDGHVVGGDAAIQQSNPKTLNIQQATDKAILNWKSFSIAADEAVHFVQPSVNSIALNRVIGTDPSVILGRLQSNGRIFLLNPNGILFGAGAQVNVGGLLATTLQIRDDDFMAGRYLFAQDPLKEVRSVINRGTIQVSDHGYAFLVAPGVSNEGLIVANLGKVVLGSGQHLTVDLMGDGLINYALSGRVLDQVKGPDGTPLSSAVNNSGTIQADGGHVILQAKAAGDIFSSVVNQSGIVRARSLENHGGVVKLLGGDDTLVAATEAGAMRPAGDVSGAVVNTGTIDISAGEPYAAQGSVTMFGERIGHFGSIAATGTEDANGGDVVIASTMKSLLASGSTVDVSGSGHSSGGRLTVWSDHDTFFNETAYILARGGEFGGNGGFIELSGKESLGFAGTVNALAPFGQAGTLLLDPRNITIAAAGVAYNPGVNNLFGNTPAVDVTILNTSINASAANVVLQANNDITVGSAITMANNGVGIAMQAGRDINVNASVTTNNGNISLTANDSAAIGANRLAGTGDITFGAGANLSAGTGSINLSIGSSAVAPFSPGSITTVRNLTTTTGNISINSPNTVSMSGAVNAGSGAVSINANSDGAGAQGFTMNAGSSIATTNTGANAVQIVVNSPTGGTGAASLRGSITTGNGGTATVSTRGQAAAGGNTTGGAITQGAVLTMNTGAAGTIALATGAAASSITLNTVGNDFIGAVGVSRAFNVALRDANALALGASTIAGALGVTTAGAVTQTGALAVTGTTTLAAGAANNITLTNVANNFSTVAITNGNNVALTDVNALVLGASTVSGTLGVTTNGALTQSGVLNVTGATTLTAGTGNNINLATSANNFSSVSITSGNNVSLRDANALVLGGSTISGNLALTTGGALTQSGVLNVTGTTSFTATAANTDILLSTQANNFGGALSFAGTLANFRDVSIRNVNAGATVPALAGLTALRNLTLTYNNAPVALPALTLTAGGSLNVTAGGAITDTGNLIVPGTTTLTAGANNITLDNANNFTGAVSVVSGNNVTLNDINALNLGASTIAGTLNVTTAGALTQSGALNVTGATTLAAGAANNITLNNAANNFSTVGITSGNNVSLRDANALVLGASTVSGTLDVTTNGALTQSGILNVTGTTTVAAGAANNVTLATAGNNFSTFSVTSGNNVAITDSNALSLGASTVSGTFGVTTGGALAQSGALNVIGATTFTATAANTDILLSTQANNFGGALSFAGTQANVRDVQLRNVNAGATVPALAGLTNLRNLTLTFDNAPIVLPALTASGNLNLTAGGSIMQTGAATVGGATTLAATVAGSDILLDTQANNLAGAVSFGGTLANIRDVGLRNANAGATVPALAGLTNLRNLTLTFDNAPMTLPTLTASGNLAATAGGLIAQSGALSVVGSASFNTTAAPALGSVTLANGAALTLNTSTVGGNLVASTTAGDLTLPAGQTLTVVGDATLAPAGNVNLLGTTRIGVTQSSTGGGSSSFTLGGDTNLNALSLPGTGNITVNTTGTSATFAGGPILPQAITLNNVGNNFGGPVSVMTAAPAFTGTTSNTYNLTQSAPVTLNAGQNLTVTDLGGTAGKRGNITLTNAANSFETVTFTGGNIAWQEANAVTIGTVSANAGTTSTGTLSITANGPVTQTGAMTAAGTTTLAAGANDITLANAGNDFTSVGIISGNNVVLTDANALTLNASAVSGNFSANVADLTVSGAVASTGGSLTLTAANSVTQSANLTASGANPVTVTATGGTITMAGPTTTTSGTGTINYQAGTDVTLGSLSTGGGVNVAANGGSVLSAAGSGTNVTAGANSTLQAFNGVVGTQMAPITVNVNPGTLSIRATGAVAGISAFLTGTVLPSNALTLLNVPPGLVCFNGCPIPPSNNPFGGFFGVVPSFNKESVIPSYLPETSAPPLISVVSTYLPGTVVTEAPTDVTADDQSVAREIPPCFPVSACKPGATLLAAPADGGDQDAIAR